MAIVAWPQTLASVLCRDGEHVGFSPTSQTLLALSAKRREVFGESHEGWAASFQEPLVRRTWAPCANLLAYGWMTAPIGYDRGVNLVSFVSSERPLCSFAVSSFRAVLIVQREAALAW